jgi:hypothetical protein
LADRLVETMTEEVDIPCLMVGSTTWRRADLDRGLEPDECYYFFDHPEQYQDKEIDLNVDPPPDLAIEIDITRSSLNRQAIWSPSPIRAKTYGKDLLGPSFWERWATKRSRFGGMCGNIAQNYGVHAAVGAMFAAEPLYCAQ